MKKTRVLFICVHNSARSQMAEALLKHLCGSRYEVYSAGVEPKGLNPYAITVLEELGIDTSGLYSKHIDEYLGMEFDYVVTLCDEAKEACPYFPGGKNYIHIGFEDPASYHGPDHMKMEVFRRVRDEIRRWLEDTFCNRG